MPITLTLFIIAVLILLNGFFAMAEMAIVASSESRLSEQARKGSRGARAALRLKAGSDRFLSSIQTGITLVNVLASVFSGATIADDLGAQFDAIGWIAPHGETVAFSLVVAAITFATVVVGELVPKRIALANPEAIARRIAPTIEATTLALQPFVLLLAMSSQAVLRLLGIKEKGREHATEADLRHLLAKATLSKAIDPMEKDMVERVIRLADRSVQTIMTPRIDVAWVDLDAPEDVARQQIAEAAHTRLVVARGSVDHAEGVLHIREYFQASQRGEAPDIAAIVRPVVVLPDTASILAALEIFQKDPTHLALVIDEHGGLQGVVTPTDILEAVTGSLAEDWQPAEKHIRPHQDGFLVDGRTSVDELGTKLAADFDANEDIQSAAGLVMDRMGRVPAEGESVTIGSWLFEVLDMDDRRIDKLFVKKGPEEAARQGETGR